MKKFEIAISYTGAIIVEVEAKDRETAIGKAREQVNNKPDKEFLEELEPQYNSYEVLDEWNKEEIRQKEV